jgi:chemotaxis response regulator CheB
MSIRLATVAANGLALDERIRVMVVDDAAVVRSTIGRWVEAEPDLEMVGLLRGAAEAIEQVKRQNPDVVILDITMPEMDGITALPLLLQEKRDLVVLMVSTLTRRNAEISLRARARCHRLHRQAAKRSRDHGLRILSTRADRQDPGAGVARQTQAPCPPTGPRDGRPPALTRPEHCCGHV